MIKMLADSYFYRPQETLSIETVPDRHDLFYLFSWILDTAPQRPLLYRIYCLDTCQIAMRPSKLEMASYFLNAFLSFNITGAGTQFEVRRAHVGHISKLLILQYHSHQRQKMRIKGPMPESRHSSAIRHTKTNVPGLRFRLTRPNCCCCVSLVAELHHGLAVRAFETFDEVQATRSFDVPNISRP